MYRAKQRAKQRESLQGLLKKPPKKKPPPSPLVIPPLLTVKSQILRNSNPVDPESVPGESAAAEGRPVAPGNDLLEPVDVAG